MSAVLSVDPVVPASLLPPRLRALVGVEGECWRWLGRLSRNGYPRFRLSGREVAAHRLVFELLRGHLPTTRELDHMLEVCAVGRPCVYPWHMDPVTPAENSRRRDLRMGAERVREARRMSAESRWRA